MFFRTSSRTTPSGDRCERIVVRTNDRAILIANVYFDAKTSCVRWP